MLIVCDRIAWRLGEETRREVGQRCDFRRGGDGGVGFGEFDLLKWIGHSGVLQGIVMKLDESKELMNE